MIKRRLTFGFPSKYERWLFKKSALHGIGGVSFSIWMMYDMQTRVLGGCWIIFINLYNELNALRVVLLNFCMEVELLILCFANNMSKRNLNNHKKTPTKKRTYHRKFSIYESLPRNNFTPDFFVSLAVISITISIFKTMKSRDDVSQHVLCRTTV